MNNKEAYNYLICSLKSGNFDERLNDNYCCGRWCDNCIFNVDDDDCYLSADDFMIFENRLDQIRKKVQELE